jgi:hypothetical protein
MISVTEAESSAGETISATKPPGAIASRIKNGATFALLMLEHDVCHAHDASLSQQINAIKKSDQ